MAPAICVKILRDCGYSRGSRHRFRSGQDRPSRAAKALPCEVARAFEFLEDKAGAIRRDHSGAGTQSSDPRRDDRLSAACAGSALRPGGRVVVYAMNGANPLVGSENLSHNIDHFYNVTEYSLEQILQSSRLSRRSASSR